jgi:hypothetical protein
MKSAMVVVPSVDAVSPWCLRARDWFGVGITVLRSIPWRRASSLIDTPPTKCSRRSERARALDLMLEAQSFGSTTW